ncbi:MAG: hypothetical protein WAW86_01415 [Gammaproteobacteria bacterium]
MPNDKLTIKTIQQNGEETEGTGSNSGQIEFRDFIRADQSRDDMLPPDEIRRLLVVNKNLHETKVKKQKTLRDERQALKDGKIDLKDYRHGMAEQSNYKAHPLLSEKAQFSGRDRQVNDLPNENIADTNPADRNELKNNYERKYQPQNAPKFTPKLTPYGS